MFGGIKYIIQSIIFYLVQIVIFNQFELFGLAQAKVFLLFYFFLPLKLPLTFLYVLGFVYGLLLDISGLTVGVNAFCSVLVMALRPWWAYFISPLTSPEEEIKPERQSAAWLSGYMLPLIVVYEIIYFILSDFGLNSTTMLKFLTSSIFTGIMCLLLSFLFFKQTKRTE